ncbi:MAG: DUF4416 family protein [Desulfobacterales bacterium]|nr:MAG: DUF4416 family protein [Desulfobacterales bacterium]
MSIPREPKPAKLVVGLFMRTTSLEEYLALDLSSRFGSIDIVSAWLPFDYTSYYEPEMGAPLYRRVFAFDKFIQQSDLAKIKHTTNQIEQKYSRNGKRRVNIDPGYLLHERFVLASGKNYSHRIYIGDGIYADLTLIYHKGSFQKLPWTYPDYADCLMLTVLERIRNKYVFEFKKKKQR